MTELKPCPFCGARLIEAEFLSTRVAKCYVHPPVDGVEICPAGSNVVWSDRADAWNRRAADGPEPIRYWERTEQEGERSSRILVDLVGRSIADIDILYINDDAYVPADRHRTVVDEYSEFVKQHEKEVASLQGAKLCSGLFAGILHTLATRQAARIAELERALDLAVSRGCDHCSEPIREARAIAAKKGAT